MMKNKGILPQADASVSAKPIKIITKGKYYVYCINFNQSLCIVLSKYYDDFLAILKLLHII